MNIVNMTITEGLAEIKLIESKISKKKQRILENLVRVKQSPDPMAADGGSEIYINSEVQAIAALELNLINIRFAIMSANLSNSIEVMGTTRTIFGWLVWKREVSQHQKDFYSQVYSKTKERLEYAHKNPQVVNKPEPGVNPELAIIEPNLNYMEFSKKHEHITDMLAKLDGLLSLKNATVLIDVSM